LSEIYLVRHATSVLPTPEFEDEFLRPLSEVGLQEAEALIPDIVALKPTRIFSSPYRRAIQTVEPAARVLGLSVQVEVDFFEHRMSDRPIANWREVLERQWNEFDFVPEGGDSFTQTFSRVRGVREKLEQLEGVTVLAGHGTVISLWLRMLDPEFGFQEHLSMPNPAIYKVSSRLITQVDA